MNKISRNAGVIAMEIRALTSQAHRMALSYVIEIGRRLVEAKSIVGHGEWGSWLETEAGYSHSTANKYMKIFTDYGADQTSLFGDLKSEAFTNLGYSKALKLLALPEEDRAEFVETHDVESLSTRDLDKLIRERDEALKAKAEAEKRAEDMEAQLKKSSERMDDLQNRLMEIKRQAEESESEADRLEDELEELRNKPVDVAVMEADPNAVSEAARAVAEEAKAVYEKKEAALKKKLEGVEGKRDKLEAEIKALEAKVTEAEKQAEEKSAAALKKANDERDRANQRAAEAEKKLAVADPETAQFKIIFEDAQEHLNKLVEMLLKAEPERKAKWKKAMEAMLSAYGEKLKHEEAR